MRNFLQRYLPKMIVGAFFAAFLWIGLCVYKDYGIQCDEHFSMNKGEMTYKYIIEMDLTQAKYFDYYGTFFDAFAYLLQEALGLEHSRDHYMLKHLLTYLLFWISAFFFYLLARDHFRSWKMGLLGSLFLFISPRILADTFYNPKDIPCMSLFIMSIYTLVKYLDRKTFAWACAHALSCALVINTRITGILVPALTFLFSAIELWGMNLKVQTKLKMKPYRLRPFIGSLLLYVPLLVFLTVLFWPTLWIDPLNQFKAAFKMMSNYPWNSHVLYMGEYLRASDLPWHYLPVWILISTPIVYIVLFLTGLYASFKSLLMKSQEYEFKRNTVLWMAWFFLPLLAIIVLKSIVYDAWRQVFFIYPAFLMMALTGLKFFLNGIYTLKGTLYRFAYASFVLIIIFGLWHPLSFMVKYHPFQNVYFNSLIGGLQNAKFNYELDYWGVSYRKALEYILQKDSDDEIKIHVWNEPGRNNALILPPEDRHRLVYVKKDENPEYFLSNYRYHEEEYPYGDEFYSIKIDGIKIMVVYKLR